MGAFIFYALHQRSESSSVNVIAPQNFQLANQPSTRHVDSAPGMMSGTNMGMMSYKDGQYTGDVADAYYGNVQVKVVVSNGKISDVQFLDYPHDRLTSQAINSQAMPYLKSEAIAAQSANVDIVSGATQTSEAFRQSLQSALTKAGS